MSGAVLRETLRRGWRGMLWWGLGLGILSLVQIVAVPSVDSIQQIADLMETMPPFMMQMFGAGDMEFLATPEGYLALQLFAFLPLVLAIYGVIAGMNIVANEEDRGIMDALLSLPIERWRVVAEKAVAYLLLTVGIVLLILVCILIGLALVPEISAGVDQGEITLATLGMIMPVWVVIGITALLTGLTRRRGLAVGLVAAFILVSYFLDTLGRAASGSLLNTLRPLSFFSHYDAQAIMQGAGAYGGLILLVVVTLVLIAGGMGAFQRRDVGI